MENYREKSFWLSTAGDYKENPPLKGDIKVDIAIVGGGFTGLSTAYFLKKESPSLKVALLESEVIGFGASGRNAGFSMTLFGFTFSLTARVFGKDKAVEAHHYMEKAVDLVQQIVQEEKIDCEYEHPGFLRVATSRRYEKRIRHEVEMVQALGIKGIEWMDKERLSEEVRSPLYLGAWWERRCGLLNPARMAWGMKDVILRKGVEIYERTPVIEIKRNGKIVLKTPEGSVSADKIVLATNAYSHLISGLKRKQIPVFTHIVLTEPLKDKHFEEIGWKNRQGIEDARNFVHYYRLTKENRLLMGGRSISIAFGKNMDKDLNEKIFIKLEEDIKTTFPVLKDINITHRWGGPVSVSLDLIPAIGFLGDKRIIFSLGCVGHGVSLTHMNGWTIADLLLDKKTERTEVFFVNRKILPMPPEPLRFAVAKAIKAAFDIQDMIYDRL
jgi:glycine/D-amino acid oxidase-like deaminating enzyme